MFSVATFFLFLFFFAFIRLALVFIETERCACSSQSGSSGQACFIGQIFTLIVVHKDINQQVVL